LWIFCKGDFSPEKIEEAGEYFGVSELAVKSHLANHRLIPLDSVTVSFSLRENLGTAAGSRFALGTSTRGDEILVARSSSQ
jgi:hypothetical protein